MFLKKERLLYEEFQSNLNHDLYISYYIIPQSDELIYFECNMLF